MFTNFIYFIVALLVYSIYQPPEKISFLPAETILLFLSFLVAFILIVRSVFLGLAQKVAGGSFLKNPDQVFGNMLVRMSAMALVLFTGNIYGMDMTSLFRGCWLFKTLPTLQALLFFSLFIGYMAVVWFFAFPVHRFVHRSGIDRRAYVVSNISFAVPVILPWLILSLVTDLIAILPFENVKQMLATDKGNLVFFLLFLFILALFAPLMIQKLWGCRPLEEGPYRASIEKLCRRAGMGYRDILYWPIFGGRMMTAGVMGLVKNFRYILVTGSLLDNLAPDELETVIAHEIGHIKKLHLVFYLFFFIGFMVVLFTFLDLLFGWLFTSEAIFALLLRAGPYQGTVYSGFQGLFMALVFVAYFRFVFGYFMRNFERQADIYVYELFDSATPLISTFQKIAFSSGEPSDKPNWHHYSIRERVGYLLQCERDRTWIQRHNHKIRRSVTIYVIGILTAAFIGYLINPGEIRQRFNQDYQEKIIRHDPQAVLRIVNDEIARHPHDSSLRYLLAEVLRIAGDDRASAAAYEETIQLDPVNATALNNLAWLYATSRDETVHNPLRALELAARAAELESAAHILDTLAECYHANGMYREAIDTAKLALAAAAGNEGYYRDQLERFQQFLKRE